MGQLGFHGTVPLVLRGTGGTEQTHTVGLSVLLGQLGFHGTVPLVGQVVYDINTTHSILCAHPILFISHIF